MKKLLSILLVLCLMVSMVPMAFAEEDGEPSGETPTIDNGDTTPPYDSGTTPPNDSDTTQSGDSATTPPDDSDNTPPDDDNTQVTTSATASDLVTLNQKLTDDNIQTINLNQSINLTSNLTINREVTINGNGYAIFGSCRVIVSGSNVTLSNVAISADVEVSGSLTLQNIPSIATGTLFSGTGTISGLPSSFKAFTYNTSSTASETVYAEHISDVGIAYIDDTNETYALLSTALSAAAKRDGHSTVYLHDNATGTGTYNVPSNVSLIIRPGVTVNGGISIQDGGYVYNSGTIKLNVTTTGTGTFVNNGTVMGEAPTGTKVVLRFNVSPSWATITVWKERETTPIAQGLSNGDSIVVDPGVYYYTASANGYITQSDWVSVGSSMTQTITLSPVPAEYRIYVTNPARGDLTVSDVYAKEGEWVYVTVKPDVGYRLYNLTAKMPSGYGVKIEHVRANVYRFKMPAVSVTVDADFIRTVTPFTDISASQWYYEAVSFAYWHGLMQGVTATEFAPNATTTRAMVVQILYRMAGNPVVRGMSSFSDVAPASWYHDAITWAAANGVVNGTSATKFSPNDPVTREQLATMLYRYARLRGYNTSAAANTNILSYLDVSQVSDYAFSALQWSCGEGIVTGTANGYLSPKGQATRAQLATMLYRFCIEYNLA